MEHGSSTMREASGDTEKHRPKSGNLADFFELGRGFQHEEVPDFEALLACELEHLRASRRICSKKVLAKRRR